MENRVSTILRSKKGKNFDWSLADKYLDEYDAQQKDIDAINAEAKENCEPLKREQNRILEEAATEHGLTKKVMKTLLAARRAVGKYNGVAESLADKHKEEFADALKALNMPDQLSFRLDKSKKAA